MMGQAEICARVAGALREALGIWREVTVELEDSCNPEAEIRKAQGKSGVLVLVATTSHARRAGSGALTDGALSLDLVVVENPRLNRKSAQGPTVTSVAEAARDALHWRDVGGLCLSYIDMQRADASDIDYRMEVHFTAQPRTQGAAAPVAAGTPEPEEILEGAVAGRLSSAMPGWAVVGALAAADGRMAEVPDTRIDVSADVASQMMDWEEGRGLPREYAVSVTLRVADADDKTGTLFRDSARAVRAALAALTGDGCRSIDEGGFHCDEFTIGGTRTVRESGTDSPGKAKTYNATATGRYIPGETTTEQEEDN